jgi:hypothetical protein
MRRNGKVGSMDFLDLVCGFWEGTRYQKKMLGTHVILEKTPSNSNIVH